MSEAKTNPRPNPYCPGCDSTPDQMPYIVDLAREQNITPAEYIEREEGTYNSVNGHFLCDTCYINAGMPSSPTGWVCP